MLAVRPSHAAEVTSYAYDQANRLAKVTDPQGGEFSFLRDALGRISALTRPNGVTTSYSLDAADQVKDIIHATPAGVLDQARYTYDAAGLRTQAASKTAPNHCGHSADSKQPHPAVSSRFKLSTNRSILLFTA